MVEQEWCRLIEAAKAEKYTVDVDTFVEKGKNKVLEVLEIIDHPEYKK